MLEIRVQGDRGEAQALLEFLAAAGAEVQAGGLRARSEGFVHQYAVVRMPDYRPAAGAAPAEAAAGPVWAESTVGRPRRELPAGGSGVRRRNR
jgi:hypothetical protein